MIADELRRQVDMFIDITQLQDRIARPRKAEGKAD